MDALGERLHRVDQLQLGVAAESDDPVELLELVRDRVEPGEELVGPPRLHQLDGVLHRLPLGQDLVKLVDAFDVVPLLRRN